MSKREKESNNSYRIWWSNVVVNNPKHVFSFRRKWNCLDRGNVILIAGLHVMALFAPFAFDWGALWATIILDLVTGLLGITVSYHRNLAHRSFKLPKWLEYFLAYCGLLALQGHPIAWVSVHRYHHQFADTDKDLHTPMHGFWFSQLTWLFHTQPIAVRPAEQFSEHVPPLNMHFSDFGLAFGIPEYGEANNVKDLEKEPFYRFLRSTYILHVLLLGLLLYALGGFPYLVWGIGVRFVYMTHVTGLVNSVCHVWGNQVWNTGDLSKNNWWVALLTYGEGWHNNHHAFPYSARHGLEWWQIDVTWFIVKFLQLLGLATDVKLPIENHKQRLTFQTRKM
ncbi:unnamed protein product [Amaranthus hypochondriacus]